ncbi:MAG: hypothetical protein RL043_781 [Pseudomonadota bacterium]
MPSFDATLEADATELRNAVDQTSKEIGTRFDFKGTSASVEQKDRELTCIADSEFQLSQVRDVLKQVITVRHGIAGDDAKRIVRVIKDSKMKVQAAIQGDAVRITGGKRDDLQAAIALLKKDVSDLPLSFGNFRD